MSISIIIPYRKDGGYRERIFPWIIQRYKLLYPWYELLPVEDKEKLFHKAKAMNFGVRKCSGDVLVLADADIFFDPAILSKAIALVVNKKYQWVMPYTEYWPLTAQYSKRILQGSPLFSAGRIAEGQAKYMIKGSSAGLIVVSREDYFTCGGMDERFVGWGCEDTAFYITMNTMLHSVERLSEKIYHHWHPHERDKSTKNGTLDKNIALRTRYQLAAGQGRKTLQKLINEGYHV